MEDRLGPVIDAKLVEEGLDLVQGIRAIESDCFLSYLESRFNSIAQTAFSHATRQDSSTAHQFQIKQSSLLAAARQVAGAA